MAIADKLIYLNETKTQIRDGLNNLGADLTTEDTFRSYVNVLNDLYDYLPKVTGSGTNVTLDDTKKGLMKIELSPSELTQDGTPTPSSPQAVHSISGSNTIKVSGLQQFNNDNINVTASVTKIDTGIKLNNAWASGVLLNSQVLEQLKPNTKYTCRVLEKITSRPDTITENQHTLALYRSGSGSLPTVFTPIVEDSTPKRTATLNTNVEYLRTFTTPADLTNVILLGYTFRDSNGNNGTIELAEFMIVEGEYTSENFPQYEAYNETDYSINLGKNLLNTLYAHDSGYETTNNGIKYTLNNDGSITISGTASSLSAFNTYGTFNSTTIIQPLDSSKNYTLSTNTLPSGVSVYVRVYDGSNLESKLTSTSITFTGKTGITAFYVQVANGTAISTPITIYPQIELGSTATSYAQYFTPIEYCKIGNYEDKIFRTSGKNLFGDLSKAQYDASGNYVVSTTSWCTPIYKKGNNTQLSFLGNASGQAFALVQFNSSGTMIKRDTGITAQTITFETNTDTFVVFYYDSNDISALQLQVSFGGATDYEPYGTNEWYIKKNIGKATIDVSGVTDYNNLTWAKFAKPTDFIGYGNFNQYLLMCESAKGTTGQAETSGYIVAYFNTSTNAITFNLGTTLETAKSLLNGKNYYYPLATPTYTPITGTLAQQLEAIWKAQSKDKTTNISQVNNDLEFIINASALQDLS